MVQRLITAFIFIVAWTVASAQAPQFDSRTGSFWLPSTRPKGIYEHSLSIFYVVVPKAWSLDNVNAPMFNYTGRYSLGKDFNLQASLATLFVSNRASVGPFWNHSFGHLHLGVGFQMVFNYGILKEFGYNTVLTGWEQQPSVALGISFPNYAVTVRGEVYYTSSFYLSEGGNVVSFKSFRNGGLNGGSITTTLEQRLWKDRVMSYGVKLAVVRYHIVAWPALPVNTYRYFVPEFQIGIKF
ncbi:MAG TPA: hypothetical protein PLX35_04875 [Cyclobacteriaceae bacterium]|nr:hypothetical protein [Cyclobacteriaceae bacterium]